SQARVVAPPSAEEVQDCDQHGLLPFRPVPGRAIVALRNKVPWCAAAGAMLRRRYAKNAYLKSLVLHKDQAIRRANGRRETARIWAKCAVPARPRRQSRWRRRSAPSSAE